MDARGPLPHTKFVPLVYTTPPADDPPYISRSRSPLPRLGPRSRPCSRSPSPRTPSVSRGPSRSTSPQPPPASSPKLSKSIQDLLRLAVRKVVPHGKKSPQASRRTSCLLDVPQETTSNGSFRTRSKSLDDGTRKPPSDCETTYRIYDSIVQEGE